MLVGVVGKPLAIKIYECQGMKIKDLFEGLSPTLYHATSVGRFFDMLQSNKIRLSPTFSKGMEANHNWDYYLSTTRTRTGVYHLDNSQYSVLIELDGRKLSSRYAGEPMDYWGEDFRKAKGGQYEQEDRLYSNKPYIDNFLMYVDRVDILLGSRGDISQMNKKIQQALIYLKKNNIPVRVYEDNRDWITGSNQHMTIDQILSLSRPENDPFNRDEDEDDRFLRQHKMRRELGHRDRPDDLKLIHKAMVIDDYALFDSKEKKVLRRYTNPLDARGTVSAELHNAQNDSSKRPTLEKIGSLMRRYGLRTPTDLADWLVDKWN